jgi:hypothetical protein
MCALRVNTFSNSNVGIGLAALCGATSCNNVGIGYYAGCGITTGFGNVVIGGTSTSELATGCCNVVLADGTGNVKMSFTATGALSFGPSYTNFGTNGQILQSTGPGGAPTWIGLGAVTAGTATNALNVQITEDSATSTPEYITFVNANTGFTGVRTNSSKLTYVPDIGQMTVPNVFVSGLGASTSTTSTNALYVAGGAYVNSLFVRNATTFAGDVTFNGTATYIYSTNTVYTDNIIELHTPPGGVYSQWTTDDGKDIGLRFHYYTNSTDTNAALVLDNTTKYLDWYSAGAESSIGDFSSATYGVFRTGAIKLKTGTSATSVTTGDLVVDGGVGISKNLYVNGSLIVNGAPITQQQALTTYEFSATAGQTTFTISGGYTVGQIEVFANGVLMNSGDYTATNGTTVVFSAGRYLNDLINIKTFSTFSVASSTMASRAYATAISVAMST